MTVPIRCGGMTCFDSGSLHSGPTLRRQRRQVAPEPPIGPARPARRRIGCALAIAAVASGLAPFRDRGDTLAPMPSGHYRPSRSLSIAGRGCKWSPPEVSLDRSTRSGETNSAVLHPDSAISAISQAERCAARAVTIGQAYTERGNVTCCAKRRGAYSPCGGRVRGSGESED